jgi:hypothetical protein
MKAKKQATPKKKDEKQDDDLLTNALGAENETEEEPAGEAGLEDIPADLAILGGDDAEVLGDEIEELDPEKIDDAAPVDPVSMSEFGVEAEETADPLSSEEKRYFMGEDEDDEDEEAAMIEDSFTPEDYEQ